MKFRTLPLKQINNPHQKSPLKIRFDMLDQKRLRRQIREMLFNKDLIDYIENLLSKISDKDKLVTLCYLKKVILQTPRVPDPDHYKAFEERYDAEFAERAEEQEQFDPIKWLDAGIEFVTRPEISKFSKQEVQDELNKLQEVKQQLGKELLTINDVLELLDISKSTLNRRIAEGMPRHQKGNSTFFVLSEITEWIRKDVA